MKYILIFLLGFIFAKCNMERKIVPFCKTCYNIVINWNEISKMSIK